MVHSCRAVGCRMLAVVFLLCLFPITGEAERPPASIKKEPETIRTFNVTDPLRPEDFVKMWNARGWNQQTGVPVQPPANGERRSTLRKVLGAAVGATGGFFAGGYIGAWIEGDCNCDDPGLRGAIIGAPIGAVAGGILGYKFLF